MMDERTIVYGASVGEHSDYKVCAIFSSRELAEDYLSEMIRHAAEFKYRCFEGCNEDHPSRRTDDGKWLCVGCGHDRSYLFDSSYRVEPFDIDPKEAK